MSDEEDDDFDLGNTEYGGINKELIIASKHGKSDVILNLIGKGASVYCIDPHGWSSLHWACANGHLHAVQNICDSIKDSRRLSNYVNSREKLAGWTSLHAACVGNHMSCIEELVHRYHADITLTNFLGEVPYDCCNPIGKKQTMLMKQLLLPVSNGFEEEKDESKEEEKQPESPIDSPEDIPQPKHPSPPPTKEPNSPRNSSSPRDMKPPNESRDPSPSMKTEEEIDVAARLMAVAQHENEEYGDDFE